MATGQDSQHSYQRQQQQHFGHQAVVRTMARAGQLPVTLPAAAAAMAVVAEQKVPLWPP